MLVGNIQSRTALRLIQEWAVLHQAEGVRLALCRPFIVRAHIGSSSIPRIGTNRPTSTWSGMRTERSSGSTRSAWHVAAGFVRQNFNKLSGSWSHASNSC